ncbi:ABC transporter ATP-binding protein [Enterococcus sp. BWB1-3]|uniref:ABC transporter ATP-binding protein n=1 Tax=Enterococcus sp. BWB1-3 TaxID=2787713 RepID=UPI00192287B8|nr:ABC transporter ATP-binding protein [Enterococcus sp. BWB1-3]MBL1230415.1 ABC transporter ATP-binding protein [Enterococcus sp. BWB1-3]
MNEILKLTGLSKSYGTQEILDEINFVIDTPEIIALVAPNGTGKTTLLNLIADIEDCDEGEVRICGRPNYDYRIFYDMSYLQDPTILYQHLTGWDHMEFIRREYKKTKEEMTALVEELGMTDYMEKKVKNYSLGMKQHLLLGIALMNDPKLLLMDEPLNGLDPGSILQVREILSKLHKKGITIILSSHNLEEIGKITENILFLHEGKLIPKEKIDIDEMEYEFILSNQELAGSFLENINVSYQSCSPYKIRGYFYSEQLLAFQAFCEEQHITIFEQRMAKETLEMIYFTLFSNMQAV